MEKQLTRWPQFKIGDKINGFTHREEFYDLDEGADWLMEYLNDQAR